MEQKAYLCIYGCQTGSCLCHSQIFIYLYADQNFDLFLFSIYLTVDKKHPLNPFIMLRGARKKLNITRTGFV